VIKLRAVCPNEFLVGKTGMESCKISSRRAEQTKWGRLEGDGAKQVPMNWAVNLKRTDNQLSSPEGETISYSDTNTLGGQIFKIINAVWDDGLFITFGLLPGLITV
jgi:hypothetical protein